MSSEPDADTVVAADLDGRRQLRVVLAGGQIAAVDDLGPAQPGPRVAPGLVDIQVNGANGHDINADTLTADRLRALDAHLAAVGVTTFFPAVTTNPPERITAALTLIRRTVEEAGDGLGIAGIHLEGPFISPEDGPRGAHDARYVRPPDWELFRRWQEAAGGMIRLVTLSPEWPQATAFIENAVAAGLRVAIGHTAASPERIHEAVAAGATMSTHLGNGSHTELPRHQNYLWEQLACDELTASLIADGDHLPTALLRVALRAKGEQAVLVSDAAAVAGLPPRGYTTDTGRKITLTPAGRLVLQANPALLAGSARLLPYCVNHVVRAGLADLSTAWFMASQRPAGLFDLPCAAGLRPGAPADLVTFERDGDDLEIRSVRRAGRALPTDTASPVAPVASTRTTGGPA